MPNYDIARDRLATGSLSFFSFSFFIVLHLRTLRPWSLLIIKE